MSALARDRTRRAAVPSAARLVMAIIALEAPYALALTAAIAHGSVAVAMVIASSWGLAMLVKMRVD